MTWYLGYQNILKFVGWKSYLKFILENTMKIQPDKLFFIIFFQISNTLYASFPMKNSNLVETLFCSFGFHGLEDINQKVCLSGL